MAPPRGLAFYDLDGTLVSSNVVTQYAWYVRRLPSRGESAWRLLRLLALAPVLLGAEAYSRRVFNQIFFREYQGMKQSWLAEHASELFEAVLDPRTFAGAAALFERDRVDGFRAVLLTGSLDFAIAPFARRHRIAEVVANSLVFRDGIATGELAAPIIATEEKRDAIVRLCREHGVDAAACRAYSDSLSDLPMLEAVGHPAAANPQAKLRRVALERRWPVLDLSRPNPFA